VGRPSQVVVLAEDERHQRFVRRYLKRLRYHDVRYLDLPAGRGCGEQWVRERYGNAVAAYRARAATVDTALIVAIDADRGDVNRRLRQLQDGLNQATQDARASHEKIVHLIPRRNIETWILCLNGQSVDEEANYGNEPTVDEKIAPAAVVLFEWNRSNFVPPAHCVPSLLAAIPEVRRLE
jgi:hypothetical protein